MRLDFHVYRLPLKRTFTISRGSMDVQETVVVELHDEGVVGFGEATQHAYYGHTVDSICASLEAIRPLVESGSWSTPEELWVLASERLLPDTFALSALDQAAHDWFGKKTNQRTYKRFDLRWRDIAPSSVTISLNDASAMSDEVALYESWPILKIKLGGDNDWTAIKQLRTMTDVPFRIDANGAWDVEKTIEMSGRLQELGVELIEQPLPMDAASKENETVFRESALPIIADESCQRLADVRECVGRFHGINVKLSKCGGITPARQMLETARSLGLKTMIGCMIESDVAISAAAQLLPLLDFVDLDGSVLLAKQPFEGIALRDGQFDKPNDPGNGVRKLVNSAKMFQISKTPRDIVEATS